MKSKVICYCVLALCLKFVASLPYSVDTQRYSGFKTRPNLELSYRANVPRPYQYSNKQYNAGAYKTYIMPKQEQQLPKINRDFNFSRNQQRYLPKGPPRQAEILNSKYINPKNTPNEYLGNRQIYEKFQPQPQPQQNNKEVLAPVPAQVTRTEPFIPEIPPVPPVPSVPIIPNQALRQVDDHYLHIVEPFQAEEQEIPVIQPPSPPTVAPESIPDVETFDSFDRLYGRASNPVEQIPLPKTSLKPPVEQFLSHPNVRDILNKNRHRKRYLVIHRNGTVEHVDKIETVAARHPNYLLVKAGDIAGKLRSEKPVAAEPVPYLPLPETHSTPEVQHWKAQVLPSEKAVLKAPIERPAPLEWQKEEPSTVKVESIVQEPLTISASAAIAEVEVATTEPTLAPTNRPEIQPSKINIDKEVLPPHDDNDIESVPKSEPTSVDTVTEVAHTDNVVSEIASPSEPIVPDTPSEVSINENRDSLQVNTENPANTESHQYTKVSNESTTPTVITESEKISPSKDEEDIQQKGIQATSPPPYIEESKKTDEDVRHEDHDEVLEKTPKEPNPPTATTNDDTVTVQAQQDQPPKTVTPEPTLVEPSEEDDELVKFLGSIQTQAPEVAIRNILDEGKEPGIWFRTSDPDFWSKLSDNKELDVVYFFQIHNQPKIEKDTKTVIHQNGTIVEDVVETSWDFEGDEPKVKKTTKIIHPEDL